MPFSFKPNQTEVEGGGITPPPGGSSVPLTPLGSLSTADRVSEDGKMGILQVGLFVVSGGMVLVALILAGYQFYLNAQIQSKKDALALYETKLGGLPLEEMRKTSNRIKVINQALQEHASVSTAFRVLEDSIENKVTYTRFNLTYNLVNKTYDLQLGVTAPNYVSIAQQLDTFNKTDTYKDYVPAVTYDGVSLDNATGNVSVTFKMPIRIEGKLPGAVTFRGQEVPVEEETETATSTGTSTPVGLPPR